jgi:peptidyl-prolyl cis-trans isomerase A (cyclophilin A)
MLIRFCTLRPAKVFRSMGPVFGMILLCLSLAAFGQTTPKASGKAAGKAPAKKASAPAQHPTAVIHTTAGDMKCELFPDKAPKAVANFIGLARGTKPWQGPDGKTVHGKPLYDGVIFHRVIPEFMVQTGDPTGTGSGDVGFEFEDELHPDLLFDQPGRLAMANRGPNTNSSQFFITEKEVPFLNPCLDPSGCMGGRRPYKSGYTIFGQCDQNTVELVKQIARMPCVAGPCNANNSKPANPVKITHIDIQGAGKSAAASSAGKKGAPAKSSPQPKSSPK